MTLDVKPGAEPWIELDRGARTFHVAAGARWRQVIGALDAVGFSPAVMQSNHDFGVAATFSVNAHGWPVPYGPFGSTVRSLRLMLASGDVVTCWADRERRALLARDGRLRPLRRHRGSRGRDDPERAVAPDLRADARFAARPAVRGEPGAGRLDPDGVRAPRGGRPALPPRGPARHAPAGGGRAAARDVGRALRVAVPRGLSGPDRLGPRQAGALVRGDGRRARRRLPGSRRAIAS